VVPTARAGFEPAILVTSAGDRAATLGSETPVSKLANAIFEYIECFHNRRRRHSALGFMNTLGFEHHPPSDRDCSPACP